MAGLVNKCLILVVDIYFDIIFHGRKKPSKKTELSDKERWGFIFTTKTSISSATKLHELGHHSKQVVYSVASRWGYSCLAFGLPSPRQLAVPASILVLSRSSNTPVRANGLLLS